MKRIFKIPMLVCLALFITGAATGQEVAATAGSSFADQDCRVDWTLGESAIQTYGNSDNIITSGFHQPVLLITQIQKDAVSNFIVSVYPNPTSDKITVSMRGELKKYAIAWLYDDLGQIVANQRLSESEAVISMASLAIGTYTLKVSIDDTENHEFKIIKSLK